MSAAIRARRLDPALLHESVDGEWSFIETLLNEEWEHRRYAERDLAALELSGVGGDGD